MRKTISLLLIMACLCSAAYAQEYKNPVIPGFYPDPSICRVGDDFFIVNSTFQFFPGVPLWHSKDLAHWEQIGNVLNRKSQLDLTGAGFKGGIYATTIRYDSGIYYMITTNVSHGGNFFVTTTDPWSGEWSEPVWLKQAGIDPSLYFEDGKCYMTSNPGGGIWLCEIDPASGEQLTESRHIWDGDGGRYPEGPHIYKKDGWYYLLISEGGTEYGHMITIARSRDIYGPYRSNPANPILTHRDQSAQSNPIQGTGHADLVQDQAGNWWMVCLGFRPQDGKNHLIGRETYLAPVTWPENGWPVVNGNGTVKLDMKADLPAWNPYEPAPARTVFDGTPLGPEWVYLRNPDPGNYAVSPEGLRLKSTSLTLDEKNDSPTFVGRRQTDINFTASTSVLLKGAASGSEAGLSIYRESKMHYDIFVRQDNSGQSVVLRCELDPVNHIETEVKVPASREVILKVAGTGASYNFSYSLDGETFNSLGWFGTKYLSSECAGGFTGIVLGLYSTAPRPGSYADFEYFEYQAL